MLEFNINSGHHISLLLFGGSYTVKEQQPIVDENGEFVLFKTGDKKGQIKTKIQSVTKKISGMGLSWKKYSKKLKTVGVYKTNEEVLTKIVEDTAVEQTIKDIVNLMLKIKNINKQISTYYDGWEQLIYPDGCIRGNFNHCATDTGRLSSDKPNTQNAPKVPDSNFRKAFVSRFK